MSIAQLGMGPSFDSSGVPCDMVSQRSLFMNLIGMSLLLTCAATPAADGLNVTITNDGIVDIFVTLNDISTKPYTTVASRQRINGFTSIPISISADAAGAGNISWTAIGVDSRDPQCGKGTRRGLSDEANVNVHVDADCGG
jgi:hypothetical protein